MSTIFISYSSRDKEFACRLATDLRKIGHKIWFDNFVIRVGDDILSKIQDGLKNCDFIILILSTESVKSNFVKVEWQAKYLDEINNDVVRIFPIIIDDCEVPPLLQQKKCADFRGGYRNGFEELMQSICSVKSKSTSSYHQQPQAIIDINEDDTSEDIAQLLISAISQGHCSVCITHNFDIDQFIIPGALCLIRNAILRTKNLIAHCDPIKINISSIASNYVNVFFTDRPLPKGFEIINE